GMILCKDEFAKDVDRWVFPGTQGGPLMHVIAGKAACFHEDLQPSFTEYSAQILKNMQALCEQLILEGFTLVGGGSENHMCLVDVKRSVGLSGKVSEKLLDSVGITCNKNAIPFDTEKPFTTSGIRLGSPAMTTRGMKEEEFRQIAIFIAKTLKHPEDTGLHAEILKEVRALTRRFPVDC
ncbi:MAG: serine hydroxymethyltransferase, partial [Erysipelotrichaceae bacterium]|nr:serine hydroxymethyltransferase [Erysipelotrichaceae bacterium]